MEILIYFAVDLILSTIMLWVGAKITRVDIEPLQLFKAVLVMSLLMLIPIPVFGWLIAIAAGLHLLMKYSGESLGGIILMVIVGKGVSIIVLIMLANKFA